MDTLEGGIEYIAQHTDHAVLLFEHECRSCRLLSLAACIVEALHKRLELMVELGHSLTLGRSAYDHTEVTWLYALHQLMKTQFFFRRLYFLRYRDLVAEGREHQVAARETDFCGKTRSFGRYRLFHNLHKEFLAGREHIGHGAVFVDFGQRFHLRQPRHTLLIGKKLRHKLLIRCKVRAQIKIMEECILFVAHVHEGGIKARHEFFHLRQVYVAHGIGEVARFFLKRHQAAFLKEGYGNLGCLYVYY